MKSNFNTGLEVLRSAQKEGLYDKLLFQIRKDFVLANVELKLSESIAPSIVINIIKEKVYFLLMEKLQQCLNLLYIVDIPEGEIQKVRSLDAVDASAKVCFLILKREWQKVWFKHKYNS